MLSGRTPPLDDYLATQLTRESPPGVYSEEHFRTSELRVSHEGARRFTLPVDQWKTDINLDTVIYFLRRFGGSFPRSMVT